jgi:hypothetical protein
VELLDKLSDSQLLKKLRELMRTGKEIVLEYFIILTLILIITFCLKPCGRFHPAITNLDA